MLHIKLEITNGSKNAIHSFSGQSRLTDERPLQLTASLVIATHYCDNQRLTPGTSNTKILSDFSGIRATASTNGPVLSEILVNSSSYTLEQG